MKSSLFMSCLFLPVAAIGQKQQMSINYKPGVTYFGKQF